MRVGEICCRDVVTAEQDETVLEVAKSMRLLDAREVVVVGREGGRRRPLGILTDRGIVVDLLACGIDVNTTCVAEVMERDLHLLHEEEELAEVLATLGTSGRLDLPVVNRLGDLVGLLRRSDLLELLGEQLAVLISLSGDAEPPCRESDVSPGRLAAGRPPME